ncbi:MAG: ATP-dependent DNA/RNA helicase [Trizodia sp. TS-e1964]|nr:MAG: ATP-dependent DNA/RNA helicase [Trizodia sp. TS-e1964]
MKRKLDSQNVPSEVSPPQAAVEDECTFASFGLDSRILQGIANEKYSKPTLVQSKAIPLALEGKDIIARAKTGSGKTVAYLIPIFESILKRKAGTTSKAATQALILVPTRELSEQVCRVAGALTAFCAKDIRVVNLAQKVSDAVQRSLLSDSPDIVIATPARVALNVNTSALCLENIVHLVIDEADLVLSYGYVADLHILASKIPKGVQSILMSATMTDEVDALKSLFCQKPVILKLEDEQNDKSQLSQYVVRCAEDEKFLFIYVIFKLKLIKGKCIIFVGDIDRCYRLKLYLEQFGVRSCILNSELPVNSRVHIVEEFNKGIYDIIIATDEHEVLGEEDEAPRPVTRKKPSIDSHAIDKVLPPIEGAKECAELEASATQEPPRKRRKGWKKDKEYGISRGIDFKNVACVLNFDLPTTSRSYTHRIGRTARAGKSGMALSFVVPLEHYRKHKPTSFPTAKHDEETLAKIIKHQGKKGQELTPYHFDAKQVEPFRYRMGDALRAVTRIAIREARTRELRQELLKSDKLKRYFEENPDEMRHLRHDGELRAAKVQPHLKHVPEYLLPKGGAQAVAGTDVEFVGPGRANGDGIKRARAKQSAKGKAKGKGRGGKVGMKRRDPLKSFKGRGK